MCLKIFCVWMILWGVTSPQNTTSDPTTNTMNLERTAEEMYSPGSDEANTTTLVMEPAEEPEHPYVRASRYLFLSVIPIITVVGVVGNGLMLAIMNRPKLRTSPVSVYMSALAIADTTVLILDFMNNWIRSMTPFHIKNHTEAGCQFYNFMFGTAYTYCAWLVVCVSVERLIVVWFPLQAKSWCTVKKALITVLVLLLPCALLQSFNFVIWIFYEEDLCDLNDDHQYFNENVQAWLTAVFYSYLPVVILIVSNALIIHKLVVAQASRKTMGAEKRETYKATFTVVLVCVFYVVLTVPLTLFYGIIFYLDQYIQRAPGIDLTRTFILILGLCNHSINFFLYVMTSAKFREAFRDIIFCGRRVAVKDKNDSQTNTKSDQSSMVTSTASLSHIETAAEPSTNQHI